MRMTVMSLTRTLLFVLVLSLAQPSQQLTQYVDDPTSCDIIGDRDVYGISVRTYSVCL
jgi:hypothetical protein